MIEARTANSSRLVVHLLVGALILTVVLLLVVPAANDVAAMKKRFAHWPAAPILVAAFCVVGSLPVTAFAGNIWRIAVPVVGIALLAFVGMLGPVAAGFAYFSLMMAAGLFAVPRLTGRHLDLVKVFALGGSLTCAGNVALWEFGHPPLWVFFLVPLTFALLGLWRWRHHLEAVKALTLNFGTAAQFSFPVFVFAVIDTFIVAHVDSATYVINFGYLYNVASSFIHDDVSVGPLFFYGKVLEVIMLPLFASESYPVLAAFNAASLLVLSVPLRLATQRLGLGRAYQPLLFAALITSPSMMFTLRGITPDLFALTLVASSLAIVADSVDRRDEPSDLLLAAGIGMLTLGGKPHWIPYVSVMVPILLIFGVIGYFRARAIDRSDLAGFIVCTVPVLLTFARNYISLGIPLMGPPDLAKMLAYFGISPRNDIYAVPELDLYHNYFTDVWNTIVAILTNDPTLYHLWISWPSPVLAAVFLFLTAILLLGQGRVTWSSRVGGRVIAAAGVFVVAIICYRVIVGPIMTRAGGGYYYNGPMIVLLLCFVIVARFSISLRAQKHLALLLLAFLMVNVALSSLRRPATFSSGLRNDQNFLEYAAKLYKTDLIAGHLRTEPRCHLLAEFGRIPRSPPATAYQLLPCFTEVDNALRWRKSVGPKALDNRANFRDWTCKSRLTHLLLYKEIPSEVRRLHRRTFDREVAEAFAQNETTLVAEQENLQLFKIHRDRVCQPG